MNPISPLLLLTAFLPGPGEPLEPAPVPVPPVPVLPHDGEGWTSGRPDGHAPIGVMGDHTHGAGEWMFSARVMRMHMEGMRDGTSSLSNSDVLADFMVTPTQMDMDMLMLGAMYAATDELTVMVMLPYVKKSMDHVNVGSVTFTTESEGLGDIGVTGLYKVYDQEDQRMHAGLGLSLPTGSIDERDDTPAGNAKLPYPMQLGSGTLDLMPSFTYLGQEGAWSWGAQTKYTLRTGGDNSEHYRLGNRAELGTWIARNLGGWSPSLRLWSTSWSNVHGADPELAGGPTAPMKDADKQGGTRIDLSLGVNYYDTTGPLGANRLALEFGVPVYQDLNGPQLETDWILSIGWQLAL